MGVALCVCVMCVVFVVCCVCVCCISVLCMVCALYDGNTNGGENRLICMVDG